MNKACKLHCIISVSGKGTEFGWRRWEQLQDLLKIPTGALSCTYSSVTVSVAFTIFSFLLLNTSLTTDLNVTCNHQSIQTMVWPHPWPCPSQLKKTETALLPWALLSLWQHTSTSHLYTVLLLFLYNTWHVLYYLQSTSCFEVSNPVILSSYHVSGILSWNSAQALAVTLL